MRFRLENVGQNTKCDYSNMRENRSVFHEKNGAAFYISYCDADAGLKDKRQLFGWHDLHPVERAYHQREVEFVKSARRFQ